MNVNIDVLIIDDDEDLLYTLPHELEMVHINKTVVLNIDTTSSPQEAFDMMLSKNYDVLLADIRMPLMDGVTFLDKARDISPETTHIVISGYPDAYKWALQRSRTYFVSKPIEVQPLMVMIRRFAEPVDAKYINADLKQMVEKFEDNNMLIRKMNETSIQQLEATKAIDKSVNKVCSIYNKFIATIILGILTLIIAAFIKKYF